MAKKEAVKEVEPEGNEEAKAEKPSKGKKDVAIYTYVGGGEDSPRVIEFMQGKQRFVRGKATEVTDPEVLAKLKNHPCFVEGEVDMEELHEYDEKATAEANAQRKRDARTNAAYVKKHKTPTKDEE